MHEAVVWTVTVPSWGWRVESGEGCCPPQSFILLWTKTGLSLCFNFLKQLCKVGYPIPKRHWHLLWEWHNLGRGLASKVSMWPVIQAGGEMSCPSKVWMVELHVGYKVGWCPADSHQSFSVSSSEKDCVCHYHLFEELINNPYVESGEELTNGFLGILLKLVYAPPCFSTEIWGERSERCPSGTLPYIKHPLTWFLEAVGLVLSSDLLSPFSLHLT